MRMRPVLTLEDAEKIAGAARAYAAEHNEKGTIAVVDHGGALLYLERPDKNSSNSVDMALGKARTAAYRERPSSALEERVKDRPGFLMAPNQIGVRGGVPLFHEGECVGGVGVSGIGNNDEPAAVAGAAVING